MSALDFCYECICDPCSDERYVELSNSFINTITRIAYFDMCDLTNYYFGYSNIRDKILHIHANIEEEEWLYSKCIFLSPRCVEESKSDGWIKFKIHWCDSNRCDEQESPTTAPGQNQELTAILDHDQLLTATPGQDQELTAILDRDQLLTTPGQDQLLTTPGQDQLLTTPGQDQLLTTTPDRDQLLTTTTPGRENSDTNNTIHQTKLQTSSFKEIECSSVISTSKINGSKDSIIDFGIPEQYKRAIEKTLRDWFKSYKGVNKIYVEHYSHYNKNAVRIYTDKNTINEATYTLAHQIFNSLDINVNKICKSSDDPRSSIKYLFLSDKEADEDYFSIGNKDDNDKNKDDKSKEV